VRWLKARSFVLWSASRPAGMRGLSIRGAFQSGCVDGFAASQVARGFSATTIENGTGCWSVSWPWPASRRGS